jgi:hypothetical protein
MNKNPYLDYCVDISVLSVSSAPLALLLAFVVAVK